RASGGALWMIYEFAIDPELVATLSGPEHRATCALLLEGLKPERGRLPSWFPKRWLDLVDGAGKRLNDSDRYRLVELVQQLRQFHVERPDSRWKQERTWLSSVLDEHAHAPF